MSAVTTTPFALLACLLCAGAIAQPVADASVEELEVVGRRLEKLRFEIENTRINVYDIFNRLNDDDQFDMHCYRRKTTGSLIKERICVPKFVEDTLDDSASQAFQNYTLNKDGNRVLGSSTGDLTSGYVRVKNREMRDRMVEIANANPELQSAILDLQGLVDEYADATEACEAGDC
jgi:hypothetical protein